MSKIEYTKKSPIEGILEVSISASDVQKELDRSFKSIQKDADFKGFRKGKVPMEIIKNSYRNEVLRNTFQKLVESTSQKAIQEHKISVVEEPRVVRSNWSHWKEGEPVEYTAKMELIPKPVLQKYEGIRFAIDDFSITEDTVELFIRQLLEKRVELRPLEHSRGVRMGDQVLVDLRGMIDGKEMPELKTQNFLLDVGAPDSIKEIDEALLGEKVPMEEKEVRVSYPETFSNKSIAGKIVTYSLKLREIKQKVYPKVTDELAKDFGAENVEEWKTELRTRLEEKAQEEKRTALEREALKAFLEENPMELPASLVKYQLRHTLEELQQKLEQQQCSPEMIQSYLKENIKNITLRAEQEVKLALLLPQVVKTAELDASNEEVEKHIEEIIRTERMVRSFEHDYNLKGQETKKEFKVPKTEEEQERYIQNYYKKEDNRMDLKQQIVRSKAIDLIVEKAEVITRKDSLFHGKK